MCAADADAADLMLLSRRIDELKAVRPLRSLVLPEALLPLQQLQLSLNAETGSLCREFYDSGEPIGIFGAGLSHGVEAHVAEVNKEFNDSGFGDPMLCTAEIVAGRIIQRVEAPEIGPLAGDWLECEVRLIDLGLSDQLMAAMTPSRVVQLAARELGPLVSQWLDLARGGGTDLHGQPRQPRSSGAPSSGAPSSPEADGAAVSKMLAELGELPAVDRPSERALWVGALINPAGVASSQWPAMDLREHLLTATTPLERLSVAKTGLIDSIYKLKGGSWPLRTYYWQ